MSEFLPTNRAAWNRLAKGSPFSNVATDEECRAPLATLDSRGWLPKSVVGLNVLCLAGAGGWQSILYAVAGANVTVVDLSPQMLSLDQQEATKRGLTVRTVEASMDDMVILEDASFDIVHQPVSTCYVRDLAKTYREIARVLRDGGIYLSQHKQPTSLQISHRDEADRYVIGVEYYRDGPLPHVEDESYRERGTTEFLHRWDDLIGELCRSGFLLEDLREPYRADHKALPGHFGHRGRFVPPYVRMKARRVARVCVAESASRIWTP